MNRILGIIALFCVPILGPGALLAISVAACVSAAYTGAHIRVIALFFTVLLSIEIFYGFDVGILSIAYLVAILFLTALRRFIALPAWETQRGWRIVDALRTFILAYALFWIMQASGICLGHVLYGYDQTISRLFLMAGSSEMRWALGGIIVVGILLRRMDEPFRHRILFGT